MMYLSSDLRFECHGEESQSWLSLPSMGMFQCKRSRSLAA